MESCSRPGGDGRGVEPHVGQHRGNFERMDEVGLAGGARLALVMLQGELVRFFDQSKIVVGTVLANLAQQIAELGNRENVGSDLLAESRHDRLYEKREFRFAVRSGARTSRVSRRY